MFKKVFIDANIFLDINDKNRKTHKESLLVVEFLLKNSKIYTSCDLITTIYYVLSKNNKQVALESIINLTEIVNIISFSNKEIQEACKLMLQDKNYKDLEDTLQYILAKNSNCDLILSNDKNFVSKDIKILTSQKFYEKYIKD